MTLELEISNRLDLENETALRQITDAETGLTHYEVIGFEEFKQKVENVLEFLRSRDFEEDDRKSLAHTRAAVNKYTGRVNDLIKSEKSDLFSKVDEQRKEINDLLSSVTSELKNKIDEFDQLARIRRQEVLEQELKIRQEYNPELKNVDIYEVIDGSWLNRTASEKKSLSELVSRLQSIAKLCKSDLCKSSDASEICAVLQLFDWSELQTIEYLNAKYAPVEEVIEEESEKIENLEDQSAAVEEVVEKEILTIEIAKKDHDKLVDILDISGVDYKFL